MDENLRSVELFRIISYIVKIGHVILAFIVPSKREHKMSHVTGGYNSNSRWKKKKEIIHNETDKCTFEQMHSVYQIFALIFQLLRLIRQKKKNWNE